MNITARLNYKTAQLKRKLFSNRIKLKGFEINGIRLQIEEDRYSNKNFTVTSHSKIEMVIDFPSKDIMLQNSSRSNNETFNNYQSIYDVLPIQGWTRMDSDYQLEKNDIILFKYLLEPLNPNIEQEYFMQSLQVINVTGRFTNTLLFKTYTLAPYTLNLPEFPEIQTILDSYKIDPIVVS